MRLQKSFFLDAEDVRRQRLGTICNFIKGTGFHDLHISLGGKRCLSKRPTYMGTEGARTHFLFYSILILEKYYTFRPKLLFSEDSLTKADVIRAYHIHLLSSYVANFIT
jgi:hypothetical protein